MTYATVYADDYGGDPTGVDDSTSCVATAIATLPTGTDPDGNTWPIGKLIFSPGTYLFESQPANVGPWVYVEGAGRWATRFKFTGTGVFWYVSAHDDDTEHNFINDAYGGGLKGVTIDGSDAGAGSIGLQVRDLPESEFVVSVVNFDGVGSVGFNVNLNTRWCEKVYARLQLMNNSTGLLLDRTDTSEDTSVEYNWFDITLYMMENQDGISIAENMDASGCSFRVKGNAHSSSTAMTNALLRIGASCSLKRTFWDVAVEVAGNDDSSETYTHTPIPMVAGSGTTIMGTGQWGIAWEQWQSSSISGATVFWNGSVIGDPTFGDIPVDDAFTRDSTNVSSVASQSLQVRNGIVFCQFELVMAVALASGNIGNIKLGELDSSHLPAESAANFPLSTGNFGPVIAAQMTNAGDLYVTATANAVAVGDTITIGGSFPLRTVLTT